MSVVLLSITRCVFKVSRLRGGSRSEARSTLKPHVSVFLSDRRVVPASSRTCTPRPRGEKPHDSALRDCRGFTCGCE